ncbi:MAG: CoB--CoM heterodisulfide reductase iron-sulfur subunit A family protein [Promethearchaeota archaeon]|nr:MAG: CoB--CoM heterodisulfide reductase iron-sulfur subunit A family protein [Candidatus Lokiarchaeota archaeon]
MVKNLADNSKSALVIGGGIAGIQAALDLGDMGIQVNMVEKKPCIGGRMAQLDKTFPTNDCSICILAPKLSECFRHPNINLYSYSEVQKVEGSAGNFSVEIKKKARYVKEDACINCGLCVEKCPMRVDDEFDRELRKRRAIYMYYLQGVPAIMTIDKDKCLWFTKNACRICEKTCEREAIDFEQQDEVIKLDNVGSIIVATGYNLIEDVNKDVLKNYGYGKLRNVVSALEFERLESASGPQQGHIHRFSDDKSPNKIAFLQCIGSRSDRAAQYCSSICCMYTTKEAMIAYEHNNELNSYVFYIDMRAGGKGFQSFLKRGAAEYNIHYIKSKIAQITEDENENPIIVYEDLDAGVIKEEIFDLVVLATCIIPPKGIEELSKILGIELDKYHFVKTAPFIPVETSKEGIFTCGCVHEPMDIPRSVAEASGAAAKAAEIIRGG